MLDCHIFLLSATKNKMFISLVSATQLAAAKTHNLATAISHSFPRIKQKIAAIKRIVDRHVEFFKLGQSFNLWVTLPGLMPPQYDFYGSFFTIKVSQFTVIIFGLKYCPLLGVHFNNLVNSGVSAHSFMSN